MLYCVLIGVCMVIRLKMLYSEQSLAVVTMKLGHKKKKTKRKKIQVKIVDE